MGPVSQKRPNTLQEVLFRDTEKCLRGAKYSFTNFARGKLNYCVTIGRFLDCFVPTIFSSVVFLNLVGGMSVTQFLGEGGRGGHAARKIHR